MQLELVRNWWAVALRGVVAILFGVFAFVWPGVTVLALALMFGAYAFVDGVFSIAGALTGERAPGRPWWTMVLFGLVGIAVGVITFVWPGITELALVTMVAMWAVVTGFLAVAMAVRLRKQIQGEWLLAASGILAVLLGFAIVLRPQAGALALAWMIGAYAIATGVMLVALGFRLRSVGQRIAGEMSLQH